MARNPASVIMRDPVCGVELDEPRTFTQVEVDGQLYYFCCMDCRKKFEADPQQFIPTVIERQTQFVNRALDH